MKSTKVTIAIKVLFALALLYYLFYKLYDSQFTVDILHFQWSRLTLGYLICAFLLMPLNWGLESLKWQTLMRTLQPQSFWASFKGVLSGISTGILTPNRVGNFIGRTIRLEKDIRTKSMLLTFLANISQFLATVIFGFLALFSFLILKFDFNYGLLVTGSGIVLLIGFLVYYRSSLLDFKPLNRFYPNKMKKGIDFIQKTNIVVKNKVLLLALLRYFVFVTQYVFVLIAFGVQEPFLLLYIAVGLIYLIMTILPSVTFGKLFVREASALMVLTALSVPNAVILLTGFFVWIINIAIPALFGGSLLIARK